MTTTTRSARIEAAAQWRTRLLAAIAFVETERDRRYRDMGERVRKAEQQVEALLDEADAHWGAAPAANVATPSEGVKLIAAEREKQMPKWNTDHDNGHWRGELAFMGASCARYAVGASNEGDAWGLATKHGKDPIRLLTIAGALIAAEIDRRLRSAGRKGASDE